MYGKMKSSFGSKRRPRKIEVDDEDVEDVRDNHSGSSSEQTKSPTIGSSTTFNAGKKSFKKSALRQSIAFDDDGGDTAMNDAVVNKPSLGRSNSTKKKNTPSSRLSFGPGEIISGDAAEALEDDQLFTPKKIGLSRRVIENNAARSTLSQNGRYDDDERPSYSKDYLQELKSSTPTIPKDLPDITSQTEDEPSLDASELDGATIVNMDDTINPTNIPTEAEIREKKARRARLAHEQDFISLSESTPSGYQQVSLLPQRKKDDTRLVREDEDLGEGFDEFVQDGRVALGRKQEREDRKRQKKEMADLIMAAEGNADEESDDSEAERRAAYEAAQTRAGMDGLHKSGEKESTSLASHVPSKITPLPVLTDCLARLQSTLSGMELDLARKRRKLEESNKEKDEIGVRETEVQELLKQAGERYAALKVDASGVIPASADPKSVLANQGLASNIVDRGLESFGNTPTVRPAVEDIG